MASASQIQCHLIADKGPGTSPQQLSAKDREILQRPYAKAVLLDMNRPDLVLQAIARLQTKEGPAQLNAKRVLGEVDRLLELQHTGDSFMNDKSHYSSDGESADDNSSIDGEEGLRTDCPGSALPLGEILHQSAEKLAPADEKLGRKATEEAQDSRNSIPAQKRRLQELMKENKRLKKRQRCLKCDQSPVSITFLPCGHCSYCYDCGQQYDTCPICFKTILADVRTFLS